MNYIEIDCMVQPRQPGTDILVALLGEIGFDTFEESEKGLKAYIPEQDYNEEMLVESLSGTSFEVIWTKSLIQGRNWNEAWEKSFQPVVVGSCVIRAPFHASPEGVTTEIIIEPKMSFGTGHHETTSLMVEEMLDMDFSEANVLDMGSGTGVLAILASKKGAKAVTAVDIDEWAYENCLENIEKNKVSNVTTLLGGAELLENSLFNVILANINRNIILTDFIHYDKALAPGGRLLLSGFLDTDCTQLITAASGFGYQLFRKKVRNNWTLLAFIKQQ
jgi:ribosomal protein L11 methyltransferase